MKYWKQIKPINVAPEQRQQTLALLKILALGNRQIEQGDVVPAAEVIARLRDKKTPG